MPGGTGRNGPENAATIFRLENGFEGEGGCDGDIFLSGREGLLNDFGSLRFGFLVKLVRGFFAVPDEFAIESLTQQCYSGFA